jgi:hypothetical protein
LGDVCFADGCDDLIVNIQNTTNKDLYIQYQSSTDYSKKPLFLGNHNTLGPFQVSYKGGYEDHVYFQLTTSTLKHMIWSYDTLSEDKIIYTEIDKYHTETSAAGPISLLDPTINTSYSYGTTFTRPFNYLRHSTNSLDYKISYKDIYRGNCAKAKPGSITIEISAISDDE